MRFIVDEVWCISCRHTHIPTIPVTTFLCANCGFGQWSEELAENHATMYPDHVVYPVIHSVTEL